MDDLYIKKLYRQYGVENLGLNVTDYIHLVNEAYVELARLARDGKLVPHEEMGAMGGLRQKGFRGTEATVLLGAIAGACSEHEANHGRPLISAILINKDTHKPGLGFFYLTNVPQVLSRKNWEDRNMRPPDIVMRERDIFWLDEVKRVHEWWEKQKKSKEGKA